MHTTIFCSILMTAHMVYFVEAIRCQSCFNYNGLACVSNPVCNGEYCLFEQILRPNGVISVKKTCLANGQYQFDDGIVITNLNQCVARWVLPSQSYSFISVPFSDLTVRLSEPNWCFEGL
ncbi:unnamed protein product [Haemonchus placei]|uniref:UPAR/Ly6 domain-containing protein n=1 Tax=Haemonchus placei TaxID=6290 RepID=A0A0N4WUD8_HAEPC|nr:unnamed protein product [Haemonchus placei]